MALRVYLRLARVQTAGVTATVPIYGYLAGAHGVGIDMNTAFQDIPIMFLLLTAGFSAHIFGFVHNELADREVDSRAGYRRPKPLPAGEVSVRAAKALAAAALAVGLLSAAILAARTDPFVLAFVISAALLALAYNYFGKSFPGGDVLLSGSIASFVLTGAAAGGGLQAVLTPGPLLIGLLGGAIIFFNNGFEGGFKDRESDAAGGKKTLILALTRVAGGGDGPMNALRRVSGVAHVAILAPAVLLVRYPFASGSEVIDGLREATSVILVVAMAVIYVEGTRAPDRRRLLALFSVHEVLAVLLLVFVLLPLLEWTNAVLLFLGPLLLFVLTNRQIYGSFSAPDV